jgi:hypothetical protein
MRRRDFIGIVGGTAVTWPLVARAQQSEGPTAGFLLAATRDEFEPYTAALREGLKEAGFVEGRNLTIEYRFADDQFDRLPALASDLIERRVAVIAAAPVCWPWPSRPSRDRWARSPSEACGWRPALARPKRFLDDVRDRLLGYGQPRRGASGPRPILLHGPVANWSI